MADQKLGNREVLNVRWAFDDPAPASMRRVRFALIHHKSTGFNTNNLLYIVWTTELVMKSHLE